jgi:hypothetical protein
MTVTRSLRILSLPLAIGLATHAADLPVRKSASEIVKSPSRPTGGRWIRKIPCTWSCRAAAW